MNALEFSSLLNARGLSPRQAGTQWTARCPAHEDKNASLAFADSGDKLLVHCHAGCTPESVAGALGLTLKQLFNGEKRKEADKRIVATYDYTDEAGALLYQAVRYEPKDFRQRKPDGSLGGWTWTTSGVRRVLYNLPRVLQAVSRGEFVLITEGEKDADNLSKLGFCATCNVGGAGKWLPAYTETLRGAVVFILPDNDTAGREHLATVGAALRGVAKSVCVVNIPDRNGTPCKDVSDWLQAGGTLEELSSMLDTAPDWTPAAPVAPPKPAVVLTALSDPDLSELDYADALARQLPPIKTCGRDWHSYQSGAWKRIERSTLRPAAQAILPPEIRTERRATALLDHLEGRFQVPAETFLGFYRFAPDGSVMLNAGNCVVAVSPNGVRELPHESDHQFTTRTAANYDPAATAPLFERVLAEALPDDEDRRLYQLCAGNYLLPDCRFETALVCYGEAGRCKSTPAEAIANSLGRDLVTRLTMSQICDPRSYHVPKLRFAAVNLGTELDAVELADSGVFKAIVSGEPIEARPIYGSPFTMQTAAKLWFLANGLPRFKHGTEAELRRTRFVRFDFLPPVKDVTLKSRLASERDGIFRWILDGLRELLTLAEIPLGGSHSRAVHERFRISNDPVGTFVALRCRLDPAAKVTKDSLRAAYTDFCERHELSAQCGDWFFRCLYERWPNLRETRSRDFGEMARMVGGIELKT